MQRIFHIVPAALFLLSACSSDPAVSQLASYAPASGACIRYIECEDGIAGCHEEAHDQCQGGYSQVDEASLGSAFPDFAREHFPGAANGVPHIVVTCNE